MLFKSLLSALLLISAVAGGAHAKDEGMSDSRTLQSAYAFDDTVRRLRSTLGSKGFTIFATIDQRAAAQSVGLDMPPTILIIYGNPKGGTPLMRAAPDFAIELPLRVLVREDSEGRTFAVFPLAIFLEGKHGLPAGMAARLSKSEELIANALGVGELR